MESCSHHWVELDEAYAIIKVDKTESGAAFHGNYGIPLVVHICANCGEIKLFSAVVKGKFGWEKKK